MLKSQIRQIKSEKFSSQRHGFLVSVEGSDSGHEGKARGVCIPPGTICTRAGTGRGYAISSCIAAKRTRREAAPPRWMRCGWFAKSTSKLVIRGTTITRVVGYAREASPRRRSTSSGLRRSRSRWAGFLKRAEPIAIKRQGSHPLPHPSFFSR